MEKLNLNELNIAKGIIRKGLLKAAESLSFFMKEKIGLKEFDFQINDYVNPLSKKGEDMHLLTTEVMGDLPGIAYLIFSKEEAYKLGEMALPPEIKNDPNMAAQMHDAIMLEVDNIISASVITEFSNIMGKSIYGNVPGLKVVDNKKIDDLIRENVSNNIFIINFKTQFTSSNADFRPEFLWLFGNDFLECVRNISSKTDNMTMLN